MRYFRIFFLYCQQVIETRSRLLVWFILAWISPLILLLFWRGAGDVAGWTSKEITSYYLFVIVIATALMCHNEEHVAILDIQEGGLTPCLLKPFSYFWLIFFNEIPYRLIQGGFSLFFLVCFITIAPHIFIFATALDILLLSTLVAIAALFLSFMFKMIVGILSFWMTETRGAFEAVEVTLMIFSGVLMPIAFLPQWLERLAYLLPFSYMIYFPIIAFEGKLTSSALLHVLGTQMIWLTLFYFFYRRLWQAGVKKYTGVGQ